MFIRTVSGNALAVCSFIRPAPSLLQTERAARVTIKSRSPRDLSPRLPGHRQMVCIDLQCAVPMIPCAWLPEKKDGSKYLRTPYFRTHPDHEHKPQCTGTEAQHGGSGDNVPELRSGPPKELPTWVRLKKDSPRLLQAPSLSSHVDDEKRAHEMSRPHEHTTRSILAACQCYVACPKKRSTRLHVDFCDGDEHAKSIRVMM
jgi:hypothetical protein